MTRRQVVEVVTVSPAEHRRIMGRFRTRVDRGAAHNGCHVWTGAVNAKGYGVLTVKRLRWLAHRFAWWIEYGEDPLRGHRFTVKANGKRVCRECPKARRIEQRAFSGDFVDLLNYFFPFLNEETVA